MSEKPTSGPVRKRALRGSLGRPCRSIGRPSLRWRLCRLRELASERSPVSHIFPTALATGVAAAFVGGIGGQGPVLDVGRKPFRRLRRFTHWCLPAGVSGPAGKLLRPGQTPKMVRAQIGLELTLHWDNILQL